MSHKIPPDSCILELGGCLGVSASYMNKLMDDPTKMVVVEGNPRLIRHIEKTKEINGCQFNVEHCVVGKKEGTARFVMPFGSKIMAGSLVGDGRKKEVTMTTIEALEAKYNLSFDCLIMDIEGSEYQLFAECLLPDSYFLKFRTMMIEFHKRGAKRNWRLSEEIADHIAKCGYKYHKIGHGMYLFSKL